MMDQEDIDTVIEGVAKDTEAEATKIAPYEAAKSAAEEAGKGAAEEATKEPAGEAGKAATKEAIAGPAGEAGEAAIGEASRILPGRKCRWPAFLLLSLFPEKVLEGW